MRGLVVFALALLASTAPTGAALLGDVLPDVEPTPDPGVVVSTAGATIAAGWGQFLVGYEEEHRDAVLLSIQLAGGTVVREHQGMNLALAESGNASRFSAVVALAPGVEFVDANGPTRLSGAQWNGAQWNGAQWNGAEWNGAQWNGAQWNGAQWNARYGAPNGTNDPGRGLQWGLPEVRAPQAWQTSIGARRADLCVLDSGVAYDHPDLAANAWTGPDGSHGWDAVSGDADPYDDAGHGTHVAGIAAATVQNEFGVAGIGNVRVMAVKILDSQGRGTEADLAFGLAWCAEHDAEVALMALEADDPGPALRRALQYAADRDVLLVASAGNPGPCSDCVRFPASDPRVVAVSATTQERRLASFSAAGKDVELAAPGVEILSTFVDDRFVYGSGTSQAAAFVAGVAALLRDVQPGLDAQDTRDLLARTARDLGASGRDASFGHGLVDAERALAGAR